MLNDAGWSTHTDVHYALSLILKKKAWRKKTLVEIATKDDREEVAVDVYDPYLLIKILTNIQEIEETCFFTEFVPKRIYPI